MKSLFSLLVLTTTLLLSTLAAHAVGNKIPLSDYNKNYLTIASVEIIDETKKYESTLNDFEYNVLLSKQNTNPIGQIGGTVDQIDLIVDKIINIGQKIWNVVEKGRPVANYSSSKATALPANTTRWDQLESWQIPRSKIISVVYKNLYGSEVVKFTYRIILLYGGSVNGTGKYIGYASVEPVEMTTAYMYTFSAKAEVDSIFNMGTKNSPLAGMILTINWTVETVLKKSTQTHTFILDGAGNITTPAQGIIYFNKLK